MGNRASIQLETSNQIVYLQWNGGLGSVRAFIAQAKKASGQDVMKEDFIFYLFQAIRDYFNYCGDKKYRACDQLSLYIQDSINDEDNGHYFVNADFSIDLSKANLIEDSKYTESSLKDIASFFYLKHDLLVNSDYLDD